MSLYQRSSLIVDERSLQGFQEKRILVIGLGGVGGYAVEGLARAGFKKFVLVDFDVVSESNINRQIIALHSTIGRLKSELFKERVLDINPQAEVEIITEFFDEKLRLELLDRVDFVVDAIDSLGPKVGLLEDCYNKKIKVISSMGSGNRLDPSKIRIADLAKSKNCTLASRVRKYLRRRGITKGIPVVYSEELPIKDYLKEGRGEAVEASTRGRDRTLVGSISYYPAIMGMMMASYVIRYYIEEE
ncbi:tRNA threonylcarbamoyladenosine dehydratase [bacterium]|nr:tRNA threonylcarbamoyladenosine dehydratase [bacterium]